MQGGRLKETEKEGSWLDACYNKPSKIEGRGDRKDSKDIQDIL